MTWLRITGSGVNLHHTDSPQCSAWPDWGWIYTMYTDSPDCGAWPGWGWRGQGSTYTTLTHQSVVNDQTEDESTLCTLTHQTVVHGQVGEEGWRAHGSTYTTLTHQCSAWPGWGWIYITLTHQCTTRQVEDEGVKGQPTPHWLTRA